MAKELVLKLVGDNAVPDALLGETIVSLPIPGHLMILARNQ